MDLKETKNFSPSVKMNVIPLSERNNSDGNNNDNLLYNVLFPPQTHPSDPKIEDKNSNKEYEKTTFGNVSTLDWLKTWRSLEKN